MVVSRSMKSCGLLALCLLGVVDGKESHGRSPAEAPPSRLQCPQDYQLQGTLCVKTESFQPKVVCDSGVLEGTECVSYYSATRDCPPNFELKGDKCARTDTVPPTPSCPPDSYLDGLVCNSRQSLQPTCPAGTVEAADRCRMDVPSSRRCPPGFTSAAGYHKDRSTSGCVKKVTVPATETCTKGFTLASQGGVCELVQTLTPQCPPRTKDEGEKCAMYHSAERRCAPDFHLVRKSGEAKCVREVSEPATPKCSQADYILSEDKKSCVKTTVVDPVCRPGLVQVADGRCASYSPATPTCGEGFSLSFADSKPVCAKAVKIAASVVCSDGYELSDSSCVKKVPSPMVCPAGSRAEGEGCVASYPAMSKCLEGYSMLHGKCTRVDTVEATASCTKDFVLSDKHGVCEKLFSCDPLYVCPKGAREDDRCVTYESVSPVYICPEGFRSSPGIGRHRCVQDVAKDCSTVEYQVKCTDMPECYTKDCMEKYAHSRALRNISTYFRNGQSVRQVCEKVAVTVPKVCEKALFSDAMRQCPADAQAQGKGCVKATYSPLVEKCPKGEFDKALNQCVKLYKKPAVFSCGDDYSRNGAKCSKMSSSDVQYYCKSEDALVGHKCEKPVAKVCEGGQCERRVAMLADVQCPTGFHLGAGSEAVGGSFGACVMNESSEVVYTCAGDSELVSGEKCATYFARECAGGSCERKSLAVVDFECPAEFTLLKASKHFSGEAKCVKTVEHVPEYFCSKAESTLLDGKCVKYFVKQCPGGVCQKTANKPVAYVCPDGYSKQRFYPTESDATPQQSRLFSKRPRSPMQVKCVATEEAAFQFFCSKGELADNGKCAKYFHKTCPHDRCEITVSSAPKLNCEEGFTLSRRHSLLSSSAVPLCKAVELREPVFKCHKGQTDSTGRKCRKSSTPKSVCPKGASRSADKCVVSKYEKPASVYV